MAYSGDVVKYVIGGACASDTWSTGVWQDLAGLTGTPTPSQMNAAAASRLSGFNSLVWGLVTQGLKAVNASGITLATCKSYLYRNGVLTAQGAASITPSAGSATPGSPFYTALCVSTLTNTPGRSGRGRMYLPITAYGISPTTGQYTNSAAGLITSMASWLTGFGPDDNLFPGDPASHAVVLSQLKGQVHPITSIRADSLPDTQHGRINKDLPTSFYTGSV